MLDVAGEERELAITDETSIWRGAETTPAALNEGDDLMVRTHARRLLERGWANLVPIRGTIVDATGRSMLLERGRPGPDGRIELVLSSNARVSDALTGAPISRPRTLAAGSGVYGVGVDVGGRVEATTLDLAPLNPPEDAPPPDEEPVQLEVDPLSQSCVFTYSGTATLFDCKGGQGRCGTCPGNNLLAWPHLDSGCGCCRFSCCNCSDNCKNQIDLNCGKTVTVTSRCDGEFHDLRITDCGPCQRSSCASCNPAVCGRRCVTCGLDKATPIVDLTRETYTRYHDPALRSCFPARAKVVVTLPSCS